MIVETFMTPFGLMTYLLTALVLIQVILLIEVSKLRRLKEKQLNGRRKR